MQEKCIVNKCDRKQDVIKHKLCKSHYIRFRKHGDPGNTPISKRILIETYEGAKINNNKEKL